MNKEAEIARLLGERIVLVTYLLEKVKAQDFHGVADAAMDIREIDAQLQVLRQLSDIIN